MAFTKVLKRAKTESVAGINPPTLSKLNEEILENFVETLSKLEEEGLDLCKFTAETIDGFESENVLVARSR